MHHYNLPSSKHPRPGFSYTRPVANKAELITRIRRTGGCKEDGAKGASKIWPVGGLGGQLAAATDHTPQSELLQVGPCRKQYHRRCDWQHQAWPPQLASNQSRRAADALRLRSDVRSTLMRAGIAEQAATQLDGHWWVKLGEKGMQKLDY